MDSGPPAASRKAERHGERVVQADQFEWLARAGLLARGLLYGIIGVLALKLALGAGGKATNQQGALQSVARQPFGKILLILVTFGLAGYAFWRLVRAGLGHGPEDTDDAKDRIAGLVSALAYGTLCATGVQILLGAGGGGGPSGHPGKTTGGVLSWPGGQALVVVIGLIIIGIGLDQGRKAIRREFLETSKTEEMGVSMRRAFTVMGVFGHLARGVVFMLIGYLLARAAIDYNPADAVGLDGALARLDTTSYGPILLAVVAAGLIGFALYSVLDSRYRRV